MVRKLTEAQVEESLRFANGALAATGHFIEQREAIQDIRLVLQNQLTMDEFEERAYQRISVM